MIILDAHTPLAKRGEFLQQLEKLNALLEIKRVEVEKLADNPIPVMHLASTTRQDLQPFFLSCSFVPRTLSLMLVLGLDALGYYSLRVRDGHTERQIARYKDKSYSVSFGFKMQQGGVVFNPQIAFVGGGALLALPSKSALFALALG
ncbi:hypothetical protein [Helicobacter felis]|uniref:Uncharacterized protein n=1 Tax=Helicobacter felis (strain ATCC 49179 / CCUG 28539 / NCTC 12436 / CS1) TaxID=936155 RepID=E7AC40_HELFC|nr:hypothetical protein [Helicobacter felis]CBY82122.1 unnamed protein product [Helicobacter felis ATCC 49179]